VELKRLSHISEQDIKSGFASERIRVFTDSARMVEFLLNLEWQSSNLLMMSSGNFDGIDMAHLAEEIISRSNNLSGIH
jgi:UDP-N-acetylmuramate: L-alanyl-gamma-D-glutamyl-meso-diaminopimelate ligase